MTDNFIRLEKNKVLRFEIIEKDGTSTGNYLEFDMEDIELPLRINECDNLHKKNLQNLRNQLVIIDKKEDKKGKFLLTWKEEEKIKAVKEFYEKEAEALDLFLGKDGTKKLLNGRNYYYSMYEDINKMLQPILPKIQQSTEDILSIVKDKYKNTEEKNVLE